MIQLKNRNEKALEYVLTEYGWIIKTIVKKHLYLLPNLQEECMNDVLLAIWNHIDSYHSDRSTFKNWIAGIARFKAIDCKRKYLRYLAEESLDMADEIADPQIDTGLMEQEISEEVEEILSFLNEKDKILFKRLFIDEEAIEIVAADMNMDKARIYNHVSRGKKRIKKFFLQLRRG
jgi:RNA polymerase sigma-70 factor (ECF subfamily)